MASARSCPVPASRSQTLAAYGPIIGSGLTHHAANGERVETWRTYSRAGASCDSSWKGCSTGSLRSGAPLRTMGDVDGCGGRRMSRVEALMRPRVYRPCRDAASYVRTASSQHSAVAAAAADLARTPHTSVPAVLPPGRGATLLAGGHRRTNHDDDSGRWPCPGVHTRTAARLYRDALGRHAELSTRGVPDS